jgi:hypothetical protein
VVSGTVLEKHVVASLFIVQHRLADFLQLVKKTEAMVFTCKRCPGQQALRAKQPLVR